MQRIFVRFFTILAVVTVGLTLLGNFVLQTRFAERQAQERADSLCEEIQGRIEENKRDIEQLKQSLGENYLARAHALAEMIAQNPQLLASTEEMQRIADILDVDEVHVTDDAGVLRWSSDPSVIDGLDFHITDQTRPFLPALTDKSFALAQDPLPSGSTGKPFQYFGVARTDRSGIVQVGISPEILEQALANNRIDVLMSKLNVGVVVRILVFNENAFVVGDTSDLAVGQSAQQLGIEDILYDRNERNAGWQPRDGSSYYTVYRDIDSYRLEFSFAQGELLSGRNSQTVVAAISSLLLGLAIITATFWLLRSRIIRDMEAVNRDLGRITQGSLDVVLTARATPEFKALSDGINDMVDSLRTHVNQITRQAADLEAQNRDILSSLRYAQKIQQNLLPSPRIFDETFSDYSVLWKPRDAVGGDIYWMKRFAAGSVLCVCDCTGHGTPGALLSMLVVSALDSIVDETNREDPAGILYELDRRLIGTLNVAEGEKGAGEIHDGADLAILWIDAGGTITLASAKLHMFLCDGETVRSVRGQKLSLGDGSLQSREQIETRTIAVKPGSACYIASDGLFGQVGGEGCVPFGYKRFREIVLLEHNKSQAEITQKIWTEFETYMGAEDRRDDVTLVGFRL